MREQDKVSRCIVGTQRCMDVLSDSKDVQNAMDLFKIEGDVSVSLYGGVNVPRKDPKLLSIKRRVLLLREQKIGYVIK